MTACPFAWSRGSGVARRGERTSWAISSFGKSGRPVDPSLVVVRIWFSSMGNDLERMSRLSGNRRRPPYGRGRAAGSSVRIEFRIRSTKLNPHRNLSLQYRASPACGSRRADSERTDDATARRISAAFESARLNPRRNNLIRAPEFSSDTILNIVEGVLSRDNAVIRRSSRLFRRRSISSIGV